MTKECQKGVRKSIYLPAHVHDSLQHEARSRQESLSSVIVDCWSVAVRPLSLRQFEPLIRKARRKSPKC